MGTFWKSIGGGANVGDGLCNTVGLCNGGLCMLGTRGELTSSDGTFS